MLRLIIFIIIYLISNSALANCNFKTANYLSELGIPKKIQSINIEIPKAGKYNLNSVKILVSRSDNILPHLKKTFRANVIVKYGFGKCTYKARIRQNGDWKDHIKLDKNGKIIRSLNVRLSDGNILNAVKFRLLIPETRNNHNEILGTLILRELNFISPETFEVNTVINNVESVMLFQEIAAKELLEKQKRREGPLFEGDESILWSYKDKEFENFELESLSLARMINQKWFIRGESSQIISLKAFDQLQNAYLNYSQEIKKRKKVFIFPNNKINYVFDNFFLTLLAMDGLHGLRPHNRQYYYNVFLDYFEPVYYDGNLNLNKKIKLDNSLIKLINREKFDYKYLNKLISIKNSAEIFEKFKNRVLIEENEAEKFFHTSTENIIRNIKSIINLISKFDNKELNNKTFDEQIKNFKNFQSLNEINQIIIVDLLKKDDEYIAKTLEKNEINLSVSDVAKLISRNKLNNDRAVYIKKSNSKNTNVVKRQKLFDKNNSEILYSGSLEISIDENTKNITFKQKNKSDWVLIKDTDLIDWNINFIGTDVIDGNDSLNKQRFNSSGMTGCLNFYKVYFKRTSLKASDSSCEDSINIVNSKGYISNFNVINAKSDAIDIDFSEVEIDQINVTNAGNDCFDVSGGKYKLNNINLNNCKDKGISVGEKSYFFAKKLILDNSKIGVSSKDSSTTKIDNANFTNTKYCFEVAKKKQEFQGAILKFEKLNCEENYIIDESSLVEINKK